MKGNFSILHTLDLCYVNIRKEFGRKVSSGRKAAGVQIICECQKSTVLISKGIACEAVSTCFNVWY